MSFIGTATAGATTTFRLNYVPEILNFAGDGAGGNGNDVGAGGFVQVAVDGLSDSILTNLNQSLFRAMSRLEGFGAPSTDGFIRLSNGEFPTPGGQCVITVNNQSANDIGVFEMSMAQGTFLVRSELVTVLGGTNREFKKFSYLHCQEMVRGSDIVTIEYNNGHVENNLDPAQLESQYFMRWGKGSMQLAAAGSAAGDFAIVDNSDADIKRVNLLAAADRIVAVRRIVPGTVTGLNQL